MPRGSKPGERRGGRQKGTPNKFTADVRQAIIAAFNSVGGAQYLETVAKEDPRSFCTLLGKILPTEHTGEGGGPLNIVVKWQDD